MFAFEATCGKPALLGLQSRPEFGDLASGLFVAGDSVRGQQRSPYRSKGSSLDRRPCHLQSFQKRLISTLDLGKDLHPECP